MRGYRTYFSSNPYNYKRERVVSIGQANYTKEEAKEAVSRVVLPKSYIHESMGDFQLKTEFNKPRIMLLCPSEENKKWLYRLIETLRFGPKKFCSVGFLILKEIEPEIDYLVAIRNTIKEANKLVDEKSRVAQICYLTTRKEIDLDKPDEDKDLFELEGIY